MSTWAFVLIVLAFGVGVGVGIATYILLDHVRLKTWDRCPSCWQSLPPGT